MTDDKEKPNVKCKFPDDCNRDSLGITILRAADGCLKCHDTLEKYNKLKGN